MLSIGFECDDWFDDESFDWETGFDEKIGLDEQIGFEIGTAGFTVIDALEWRCFRSEARPRSTPLMDIEVLGPPLPPFLGA
jgi:hypothetical protein